MSFPAYETKRLIIDQIKPEDDQALFELFSDKNVVKYYDLDAFTKLQQAQDLIHLFSKRFADSLGIRWAIRLKNNNLFIGTCGFNSWSDTSRSATIGYDLKPEHWGNGFMTEALSRIIKAGYNDELVCKSIHRIQADTIPGNIASEIVLKKLGFKEEGIRRDSGYWKNNFYDLKCFGLLKNEFNAL